MAESGQTHETSGYPLHSIFHRCSANLQVSHYTSDSLRNNERKEIREEQLTNTDGNCTRNSLTAPHDRCVN